MGVSSADIQTSAGPLTNDLSYHMTSVFTKKYWYFPDVREFHAHMILWFLKTKI